MKNIIILGKNGQLGHELVEILKDKKERLTAYSHEELDISDTEKIKKIFKKNRPEIVINTTAFHVTSECERYPLNAFNINCVAVKNLAKISKEINAKLFTYSTNYVFDGKKNALYKENDLTNPLQMYGLSKLSGELASLNEHPQGTYVIRTCSVFGGKKGSKSKKGNYILKILEEARRNKEVYASRKQIVNPTYARHLALATIDLIDFNAKPDIYHLINEGSISWYDYAQKIIKFKKIEGIRVKEFRENEENKNFKSPDFSALANTKAKKIGIILPSVEEGLREYLKTLY